MTIFAMILAAVVAPFIFGYIYGSKQIDPDTPEGRSYYYGNKTKG
jgi:hypothetical protein